MDQKEALSFVEHAKRRAEQNLRELDATIEQLQDADDDTAAAILTSEDSRAIKFHEQEIKTHKARLSSRPLPRRGTRPEEAAGATDDPDPEAPWKVLSEGQTPFNKAKMEARLRAMGATPALGGLMMSQPVGRNSLQSTDSPAARELFGREANSKSANTPAAAPEAVTPPWKAEVQLRHLSSAGPSRGPSLESDYVRDELSAMFAKRVCQVADSDVADRS